LERLEVIIGYTVRLDHAKLGRPLEAFTELRFAGTTPVDEIAGIADSIPEVQAVFTTAGDPDALVWIRVKDVADLKRVVDELRRSGRVTGTKTLMVLGTSARAPSPL
jgi:Lrp/AsnC family leucine-responsive transcriptional regulator